MSVCEEEVYSRVYSQHATEVRNYVYYKCGDLNQAEDFMHEAFTRLWEKCSTVAVDMVKGFLFTVSKRLFIDKVRSEQVSLKFNKQQTNEVDSEDPYFHLRTQEFQQQLEEVISKLPDGQREAFLLNRIDKLTYKEIAERLEISQTAVEKRISKALLKLKAEIDEFGTHGI